MKRNLSLIFALISLFSCSDNKNSSLIKSLLHKNWQFKKYDVIHPNLREGIFMGGDKDFSIDFTNEDTAIFRDLKGEKPAMPTPYKIIDSTIVIKGADGPVKFDILKLTTSELTLCPITKNYHPKKTDSNIMVMVFKVKQ